ncbi:MAG TPA: c(7)-type cytochrome triheme domain-containing protein [Thermodesulfobacteriota bacterium]|nr:c(7)-type cytochrome triheme domain-containing protein [Thermodesulfobacteriota bacterium]
MKHKIWGLVIIAICVLCLAAAVFAQAKKTGGGDVKFTPKGADPVTFSHESHVNQHKAKCTDCHTKIFPMKKQDLGMTKEMHGKDKFCGACHNGTKAFSQAKDTECGKCHKKA